MLTVAILKNGNPLLARSAKKVAPSVYECDDGTVISHEYDQGAVGLAHKMLDTIHEKPEDIPEEIYPIRLRTQMVNDGKGGTLWIFQDKGMGWEPYMEYYSHRKKKS